MLLIMPMLFLSGCFNFNQEKDKKLPTDERSRIIEHSDFTMKIPREWDVIEPKDFTSEVPQNTLMVLRNNVKNENFTANVNILKNNLQLPKETLEYAKEVINRQKNGLYNYKETKKDLVKIQIGNKKYDTYIVYFEGKKSPESELAKFVQTFGVKGNFAYIVTGAVSPNENSNTVNVVEDIVKTFVLK